MAARAACLLQRPELAALLSFQLRELRVLSLQLHLQLPDALHVILDAPDLPGARVTEVAVVGEHAAGDLWVALVQQQLQRLLAPNQVRGPHLACERVAVGAKFAFTRVFFSGERGAL